ncbi:sigma-70 family RNA polymerase sigma factor [Tenacibaculum finnmarkense genomovar finnmarkense]|uniref:RNA polymerase sigma factor n=1 Tax=Tenacibaculum finnmarkense TaxID=2781243 RepID=UPI00187BBA68|nr:sigma-70 family RNA polymerase sigma factor [Tenacibaculum finnmarkense]MBE7648200.1 sigma-70 family RNA polymerase sigma factor [Tenacibaculum finnmarkense genomovar ulcerans]MBE7660103.1 sigma-70 family RNA polymerase sigma factor [Tenacibaculum finnmarkense genomovar finnmarkense]MCD8400326.1 sigma-70 family RNA polymerase sigma factor [Tenacibaculum finnmarkense genomovar ulcerans]MCD8411606.1 sigma-70 family RNA polymerase sigma factor [Tenacibaculum finnmarkense genomovar ulcerans]MCD
MKSIDITKLSDEELVSKIVEKNDSHLFAVLYDRYAGLVYNKCYGFSKNKEEAQDLTHDVFIRLFVKLRTFKGRSKFSTWLYSFTYNFCVNYVQRNKEKKKEKVTVVTDQIKEDSNEDEIDDAELFELKADKLAKVLEMIPAPEKMILLMKYQDDMSIKEISEALSLGDSAVKMRLKRAKEKVIRVYNTL